MRDPDLEDFLEREGRKMIVPFENLPIKQDTLDALQRYLDHGLEPGGFLMACLCNNLMEAFARADYYNRATLYQICMYIYNDMPSESQGSLEKVRSWIMKFREQS